MSEEQIVLEGKERKDYKQALEKMRGKMGDVSKTVEKEESDSIEEVLNSLHFKATKGDSQAAKLWLEVKGALKGELVSNEPSAIEYTRIGREVAERLREELKNGGVCPICGGCKEVRNGQRLDTGREQQEED